MKKAILLCTIVLAILIGGVLALAKYNRDDYNPNVKSFQFSDYRHFIDTFPSEENIGAVVDTKTLVEKAEDIWIQTYGEQIKKQRPYEVFYDEAADVWLVCGTLPDNMLGGVANILVENATGKVLAVWHEK